MEGGTFGTRRKRRTSSRGSARKEAHRRRSSASKKAPRRKRSPSRGGGGEGQRSSRKKRARSASSEDAPARKRRRNGAEQKKHSSLRRKRARDEEGSSSGGDAPERKRRPVRSDAERRKRARDEEDRSNGDAPANPSEREGGQRSAPAVDWGPVLEPYLDVFDACEAWLDECAKGLLRTVIPLPLHKQMQLRGVSTDTLNRGDARFAAVRATLSEFRDNDGDLLERSDTQIMFHQQMLNAAIQVIYGKDFDASAQRILEVNDWERFQQEVLIVTARGIGKTWSVAMFVAALLMRCPAISISVFAVAKRAAVNMIHLIDQMVTSHPEGRDMVITPRSAERLRLQGPGGPADVRVVTALPSRSDTTRGTHSNVVIVDEMAFITESLLKETILPTIVKKRTCMIGISTPQGSDNIYTWLTNFVEPGTNPPRLMFNVVQAGRVCPACMAADKALECTHMRASVPPWMSLGKVARMQQLYADDPALHARENLGVVADMGRKAFPPGDVDALAANVAHGVGANGVKCVYVACDPSGGGSSEFAIVAIAEELSGRLSVPPSPLKRTNGWHRKFTKRTRTKWSRVS